MKDIKKVIFMLMFLLFAAGCAGQRTQDDGVLINGAGKDGALGADGDALVCDAEEAVSSTDDEATAEELAGDTPNTSASVIYVQVAGAVHKPGVYELPEGSRVFQAIELAGGTTAQAELKSFNQAALLSDGEMIWVMTMEEAAAQPVNISGQGSTGEEGKINLNTATKEELMELPGIGAAKAASIIAFREENGSFTQIEDLMKIEGIKEGVFSKIEDYVIVQ